VVGVARVAGLRQGGGGGGLCTFDEAFLLLYNSSINQKGDCIWKFSTLAGRRPGCLFLRI